MASPYLETDYLLVNVGTALAAWHQVETGLAVLFYVISDIPDYRKAGAVSDAIVAFDARLAVCNRLMSLEKAEAIEKAMWNKLSARISKFYKKRHELAHFSLADPKTDHPTISPFFTWEKRAAETTKSLNAAQIDERRKKFNELAQAVSWFTDLAMERRGQRPEGHAQSRPEPHLITRLRALAVRCPEEPSPPPSPLAA